MDGLRRKPKRPSSGHVCCSNKLMRSASLSKTPCCCSQFSSVSGPQTSWHSMAMSRTISPPRCWHLLRNKRPRFIIAATNKDARWSRIISWALHYYLEERSRKQERISIRPPRRDENAGGVWRITILPSIVHWRRDFARTREWQFCTFDQKLFGCSAIRMAALTDIDQALKYARESGFTVSLLWALSASFFFVDSYCGNYTTANARLDELIALADEKDAPLFRAVGMLGRGWLLGLTGRAADAVETITSGIAAWRSTGATMYLPSWLSYLAAAHAELGQLDAAWRCIGEAMAAVETTKERWFEAEVNRTAGEIALKSPEPDAAKAEAYFERALTVARQQQAKSWELRAAMSLARLWRDQGKVQQARELLAPVYGWFTEGFDTRDLKEAKALLEELAA